MKIELIRFYFFNKKLNFFVKNMKNSFSENKLMSKLLDETID